MKGVSTLKRLDSLDRLRAIADKMGLDWIAINQSNLSGPMKLTIAPFDNGTVDREELLRREIPYSLLATAQKLFPKCQVVVRGLSTRDEIDSEISWFAFANLVVEG